MNDVVHTVVSDTFVMGLHDLANDETTVKFMVTKDKKQNCYLHHISSSMKNYGYESIKIIIDLPEVNNSSINPTKTSHSKLDWNKLFAVLNHSSYESTVNMLELNIDEKIAFVVEMAKANLLMTMFEPITITLVITTGLNELDLIKLKLPTEKELKSIVEGNSKLYNDRIEERLFCKVCIFMNHLMMEDFQFPDHLYVHISFILNL